MIRGMQIVWVWDPRQSQYICTSYLECVEIGVHQDKQLGVRNFYIHLFIHSPVNSLAEIHGNL